MSKSVKTTGDWMSLFLGSKSSSRDTQSTSTRYSGRYSPPGDYSGSRYSSRYSPPADYSGSRYSRDAVTSPLGDFSGRRSFRTDQPSPGLEYTGSRYSRDEISSPPPYRRTQSYTASSRYLPQYTSKLTESSVSEKPDSGSYLRRENESGSSLQNGKVQESKSRSSVTVLNEGTIVIRREGGVADSSDEDEEDDEEDCPEDEKQPQSPARDPLEVRNKIWNFFLNTQ